LTIPEAGPSDSAFNRESGLVIRDLSKSFAGQRALDNISMEFPRGEVTALVGQNGSGKSTLIKVLAGFYSPDPGSGEICIDGIEIPQPIRPKESHRRGLRFMHQDLALVEEMSIADNFAFSDRFHTKSRIGPISRRREFRRVSDVLESLGIELDPGRLVKTLDSTAKAMVAIARSIQEDSDAGSVGSHVLFLDEPTAALPQMEVERVFELVRRISSRGGAVIYVTHRIDEVLNLADRVVVLADGHVTAQGSMSGIGAEDLVRMIVGRDMEPLANIEHQKNSDVLFEMREITGRRLAGVDIELCSGEILGIAGLVGCGRSELTRIIAGAQRPISGESTMQGHKYRPRSASEALDCGVVYVPQDRRGQGCVPGMSFQENLTLGTLGKLSRFGLINRRKERACVVEAADAFSIRPMDPRRLVAHFSGGNQQKIVLAKAVRHLPQILVLDEPMQGVDIGGKREIGEIIQGLASKGVAVVIGSTDVEDLVNLCDRVIVLNRGRMMGALGKGEISPEKLLMLSSISTEAE
jgi:ribose transport system ATP-binding protein